ncbi:hypothetical protein DSO57_1033502 [Entomophthora muscae]|uniref:Uncharacterized protein n=1 Tax=Entomophthora muscae TaxID=34485 RepID=A0ACC2T005_9FUNG|nr:hypothetical protein DSO57_1033502 [Entomophthora muscae]
MERQLHSQLAPAPACGTAHAQERPRGSKNRTRTQIEGSHADTQASQGVIASQSPPASQARSHSLNPRQKLLSRPATKFYYTRVTWNTDVTYTSTVYPVVTCPRTLDPRVSTSCTASLTRPMSHWPPLKSHLRLYHMPPLTAPAQPILQQYLGLLLLGLGLLHLSLGLLLLRLGLLLLKLGLQHLKLGLWRHA